jgi:hypothetical protein
MGAFLMTTERANSWLKRIEEHALSYFPQPGMCCKPEGGVDEALSGARQLTEEDLCRSVETESWRISRGRMVSLVGCTLWPRRL